MKLAPVILENYNPKWKDAFNEMKAEILNVLPDVSVEHVGSTAIENMTAKPEIDMVIGVKDISDPENVRKIESLGFVYFQKFEAQVPERRYLRKSEGIVPLFHIHMVETTSDFYKNHIKFRDILNSNPALRDEYAKLKAVLAEKYKDDRETYTKEKSDFILNVIK